MENNNVLPKALTVADVMEHLGISKNTAYKLVNLNGFPKIKIGNKIIIPKEEYLAWIKNRIGREIIL